MYRSLAVPNPRISADQPSLARDAARSSDREDRVRRSRTTVRLETCVCLTPDSHINDLALSRERQSSFAEESKASAPRRLQRC